MQSGDFRLSVVMDMSLKTHPKVPQNAQNRSDAPQFMPSARFARVMGLSLVIGIYCMNLDDLAADMACLRVPGHVIANFEFRGHDGVSSVIAAPPARSASSRDASGSLKSAAISREGRLAIFRALS
jgi:hypothetical protein